MNDDHTCSANDAVYCSFCKDTGRVRGLDKDLKPTIDPCIFCYPERCTVSKNEALIRSVAATCLDD